MKIKQETIVKLFEALGFKTASNWNEKELQKKIKKLPEIVDGKTIKSPNVREALKKILDADTVEIDMSAVEAAPEPEVEITPKPEAKSKKKTKKVAKKVEKKKKVEGKKVEVDSFGNREGSIKAKINAVLTKTPKTMEQLLKDAKVDNQQNGHLKNLIDEGFVVKSDKGYALK